jgi:CopG family transcriptional regulator, nickel-responsive regulator
MEQVERIGVSLEKDLLVLFDKMIKKQGYQNRSEAIRDLIRERLSEQKLKNPKAKAVAAVYLVYDHHATNLMEKLTELQHSRLLQTVCSTHVHLDHHDCLELIVLKGKIGEINKTAENLISIKGVKLGKINLVAAD